MKRFKDLKEVKEVGDDPCGETPPEELVKVGGKVVAKKKPFEEASSAAVKLQKAFQREQERTQRERKAGEDFLNQNKPKDMKKEEIVQEGRPSQRHPLEGHEYHKKTDAELEYIAKDAHKAAEAMKSHNTTAENKYRDQANDSATVRYYRKKNGMQPWYKKKYGHIKESKDEQEYGYEGDMAMNQLETVIRHATYLKDMMKPDTDLPEWVQSKITLATDYLQTACDYMTSEMKEEVVNEGNGYDDNRTGFAKKPREDDEGHAPTKFKPKDNMSRPHTVHIDGKPWKKFDNGHQAHAAANTLSAKGKKATAIAHYKEENMQEEVKDETPPFDGPYKKTSKVVTDKSGAKHSPMSRARDLARKAAQRASTPAKLKESDSRKAAIVKGAAKGKKKTSSDDAFQAEPQLSSTITKNY